MSEKSVLEIGPEVQDKIATEQMSQSRLVKEGESAKLRKLTLNSSVLRYLTIPSMEDEKHKTKHTCPDDCGNVETVDPTCCCHTPLNTCGEPGKKPK